MERVAILLMLASLSFGCSSSEQAEREGKVVASAEPVQGASGTLGGAPQAATPLPGSPVVKAAGDVSPPSLPRPGLKSGTATGAGLSAITSPLAPARKAYPPKHPPFTGRKIALIHTANMIGEIEPCG